MKSMKLNGKEVANGPWTTMFHTCWKLYSYNKLGTGLGQKYRKNDEGDFIKEK